MVDNIYSSRVSTYRSIAIHLSSLSEPDIKTLIENASHLGKSIGGTSLLVTINNTRVFIKKIRVSDFEMQPQNFMSTRNYFSLPLYYQYGVGSTGFGTWRELAVHEMTTNWVLANQCVNFPLMYHYRILPLINPITTEEALQKVEGDVEYWERSPAIRSRLLEKEKSTTEIIIFLEYFQNKFHLCLK